MNEKELLEKIKFLKSNNEWEKIIELLNSKESFTKNLENEFLIFDLVYTYSHLATNLISKEYGLALKYFKLTEDAALYYLTQKNVSLLCRERIYGDLAYLYRTLYNNNVIWSKRFLTDISENVSKYKRQIKFEKNILRNKALYLYFSLIKNKPQDVTIAYRLGYLIMKIRENQNIISIDRVPNIKDIFTGIDIYKNCMDLLPLDIYRKKYKDFMNTMPTQDENQRMKKVVLVELKYFQQAIDFYLQLPDGDAKKRVRNNYIKAMYNYAKTSIEYVKTNNMFLNDSSFMGRSITNRTGALCYLENLKALYSMEERKKVRQYLYLVAREEKYPLDDNALEFAKHFPQMDYSGEQANYVYYTIAKYILTYRVQLGDAQSINLVIKYLIYSCLVNFYCAARYDKTKSYDEYPLILLSHILYEIDLREEYKELFAKMHAGFRKNSNGKCLSKFDRVYDFFSNVQQAVELAKDGNPLAKRIFHKIDKKKINRSLHKVYNDVDKRLTIYLNEEQPLEDKYIVEKKKTFLAKNAKEFIDSFIKQFA